MDPNTNTNNLSSAQSPSNRNVQNNMNAAAQKQVLNPVNFHSPFFPKTQKSQISKPNPYPKKILFPQFFILILIFHFGPTLLGLKFGSSQAMPTAKFFGDFGETPKIFWTEI